MIVSITSSKQRRFEQHIQQLLQVPALDVWSQNILRRHTQKLCTRLTDDEKRLLHMVARKYRYSKQWREFSKFLREV